MTVKVHMPQMISSQLLQKHPRNSQVQPKHTFSELRASIAENGFDESLLVVPNEDEPGSFLIVAGNHRYEAGIAEGMTEFPCVVRNDWDEVQAQLELVRRNLHKGYLDKEAFTAAVNALAEENSLPLEEISSMMGFADEVAFVKLYQDELQQYEELVEQVQAEKTSASQVKMIDDLGMVLSAIFEEFGDTVPQSFIFFTAGKKKHLMVAANPTLKKNLEELAEYSVANHLDLNLVLAGILEIGKKNSHMNKDMLVAANEDEGDADF